MTAGSLQFVATPIGNLGDITLRAIETLRSADIIVCEDTRHSMKLLSHLKIEGTQLIAMHQHNEEEIAERILDHVKDGKHVAVISDAGMPGICDPGSRLARAAHEHNITYDVMPGASAELMALVLSGLDSSRFVFDGFLPKKKKDLVARCNEIAHEERTVLLFEAPHRLAETLDALSEACGPTRTIALARELTKLHQEVWRGSMGDAVEHVENVEPRGEYVLVIEGASRIHEEVTDEAINDALSDRIDRGMSTRDAVAEVAANLSVPKRRVYALATA